MLDWTSGLLFEEHEDGNIRVEVDDYNVEFFGGGDFECSFDIDKENADKLFTELSKQYAGTKKEMLVAAFGETFDTLAFEKYCIAQDIKFKQFTWVSAGD